MRSPTRLPSAISLVWTAGFALGLGCGSAVFGCEDDLSCSEGGSAGMCQTSGYCAFPDAACPSGLRYGRHAPPELASVCVVDDGDGSTGSGSDSGESTATTVANVEGTGASSEDGSTSLEDSSTSSPSSDGSTSSSTDDGLTESTGEDSSTGEDVEGPPCEAGWWDDFADPGLDRQWDLWSYGEYDDPLQSDGRVRMSLPSTSDGWVGILTDIGPMLDRSAGVEWSFDAFDPVGFAWFNVQYGDKFEFGVIDDVLEIRIGQADDTFPVTTVAFDPVEHRFVRIRSADDLMYWESSSDGTNWTTLHSMEHTESGQPHTFEFGIGTWEPLTSGTSMDVHQAFRCP